MIYKYLPLSFAIIAFKKVGEHHWVTGSIALLINVSEIVLLSIPINA